MRSCLSLRLAAVSTGLVAVLASPGMAQLATPSKIPVQQRGAAPGKRQRVWFITQVHPDCTADKAVEPRVGRTAAHGKVELVPKDDFPGFERSNPRSKCNDRRFPGVEVDYTAESTFRGTDAFTIVYINNAGDRREVPFAVKVE